MTLTIHTHLEQGTEEWLAARRGIVTASTIGQLVGQRTLTAIDYPCPDCGADVDKPCIGKRDHQPIKTAHPERVSVARKCNKSVIAAIDGDDARSLTLTLAAERISGHTDPVYVNYDMLRGQEDEPRAVAEYERRTGNTVHHAGFITNTIRGHTLGYSPDGLIRDDGLIECKSRKGKKQLATMLADEVPPENLAQLHAGLLVTGRDWCDYVSYAGGWPVHIIRVTPDPRWAAAIADALEKFEETVDRIVTDWHNRYGALPRTERHTDHDDIQVA